MGIPVCLDERGRWRPGREYLYADLSTARAVEKAGGVPVVLPLQRDAGAALERIDALLLPGGDDFPPPPGTRYPEAIRFEVAPEAQRRFDAALLAAAGQGWILRTAAHLTNNHLWLLVPAPHPTQPH